MSHPIRILLPALFAALALASPLFLPAKTAPGVSNVSDKSFEKEVLKSDVPVLVDFWAPWCGPCRRYGPIVEKVAERYEGKLKVVKVNVDDNPELSTTYRIRSIPFSMIVKEGKVVKNWTGMAPERTVSNFVEQALKD